MANIQAYRKQDRQAAVATLTEAFKNDPVTCWMTPERERIRRIFTVLTMIEHTPSDIDLAVEDAEIVGVSMWNPPHHKTSVTTQLSAIPLWIWALGKGLPHGNTLVRMTMEARPKQPFLYLGTLGAAVQGRGYGSALLAHRLNDFDGRAYLESSNEANIPLYERYGFKVTQTLNLPDGPQLWPMLRE